MSNPLTEPTMPEWNNLKEWQREQVREAWEMYSCEHSYHRNASGFYGAIRKALIRQEENLLASTMQGPPASHWHLKQGLWAWWQEI